MTKEYNVVWSITIDAATHLHAAFLAKKIQQDPASVANYFVVTAREESLTVPTQQRIDVDDLTPNQETQSSRLALQEKLRRKEVVARMPGPAEPVDLVWVGFLVEQQQELEGVIEKLGEQND